LSIECVSKVHSPFGRLAISITLYKLVGADAARLFSPHCWKARMA
jgi:hypothetical protein